MTILTVTSKGQVTLRKEVLRHLGVAPGGKIEVDLRPDGTVVARAAAETRTGSIEDVFGMLASPENPVLTLEEIKTAIEEAYTAAGEGRKTDPQ